MVSRRNLTHKQVSDDDEDFEKPRHAPFVLKVDPPDDLRDEPPLGGPSQDNTGNESTRKRRKHSSPSGRPNLSVLTQGLESFTDGRQFSASSITSHIKDFMSPRLGSGASSQSDNGDSRSSDRDLSASEDEVPRSAKVISVIDEGDYHDFKDLQEEFRNAMGNGDTTWLPSLQKEEENAQDRDSSESIGEISPETSQEPTTVYNGEERPIDHGAGNAETIELMDLKREATKKDDNIMKEEATQAYVKTVQFSESSRDNVDESSNHEDSRTIQAESSDDRVKKSTFLLYGRSLGVFSPENQIRYRIAQIVQTKLFSVVFRILMALFVIILAYKTYNSPSQNESEEADFNNTGVVLIILNIFFTLEVVAKIIAFGFWDDSQMFYAYDKEYKTVIETLGITKFYSFLEAKYGEEFMRRLVPFDIIRDPQNPQKHKKEMKSSLTFTGRLPGVPTDFPPYRAFARSSWHRIDLLSTICFWIALCLSFKNFDEKHGIRIFKALSALRILKITNTETGLSSILRSLKYGLPQLISVGFMLLYFWVFFGILAVQSFQGSLKRRCVWTNPSDPSDTYDFDMQFCGSYLDPNTGNKMNYIFSNGDEGPLAKGFSCPVYSKCISDSNPYSGSVSFDNIINSMELIFVIMSANTFTDIMYYTMDSDSMAACVFFIFSIFFLNIWMINLLIAVLVSSFERANEMFKRKKRTRLDNKSNIRKVIHFIKKKAHSKELPSISKKAINFYEKVEWIFVILIVADMIMQATATSRSSKSHIEKILKFDQAVAITLFIESIFRVILHFPNLWRFLLKPSYVFDLIVSIISLVITSPHVREKLGESYYWLNLFQVARFYRVAITVKVTKNLWKRALGNILMIWNLSGFYFLFLFLVAIILSIYFEGTVPIEEEDENPFAMYSLANSFLSLFIIGSTENWTDILYKLQENAPNTSSQFFGSTLLIIWFFLANFVVLNIFIALIAESLDVNEENKRPLQIRHYLKNVYPKKIKEYTSSTLVTRMKRLLFRRGSKRNSNDHNADSRDFRQFLFRGTAIVSIAKDYEKISEKLNDNDDIEIVSHTWLKSVKRAFLKLKVVQNFTENPFYRKPEILYSETVDSLGSKKFSLRLNEFEEEKLQYLKEHPFYNNSYFIFAPNHMFRRFCQSLVSPSVGKRTDGKRFLENESNDYTRHSNLMSLKRDLFTAFISLTTFLLVIFSCYITPLYRMEHSTETLNWTSYCEITFVTIFSLEFVIKTVADGLIHTPNAYLRNPWNCIDLIVLFSLRVDFISDGKEDKGVSRVFRGLTALRALRCLTISKTARAIFNQVLFDGFGKIIGAAIISLSLLFPFAVWGLGLFRGRLGVCNDSVNLTSCYNEYTNTVFKWDILMPRVYDEPYLYMNSFSSAFRSLYEIVSLEGWVDLLQNSMASTGIGTVPETFATPQNGIFFVLFNFLSMVFILTLFISFIISNHTKRTGSAFYTIEEKSWLEVQKLLSQAKPEATPDIIHMGRVRLFLYRVAVEKKSFLYAIFLQLILCLHIFTLLLTNYNGESTMRTYQNVFFMFSSSVFTLHECFYLYALGFRLWSSRKWNIFRFFVVTMSASLRLTNFFFKMSIAGFTNVVDFFQLTVFLFVIPQNDTLSELISTAMASLPSMLSLIYTWGILFLVYSIAMNQIFGLTRLGPNTSDNINFRTVTKSMIVLFRCSFGEGWNYIMNDLTVSSPFCYVDEESGHSDCGSKAYAYVLLMSWNLLSMYIFLNMFISLILENFSYLYHGGSGSKSVASREEIRKFKNAWKKFDPDGVGQIDIAFLPKLMHSFDGPLSFKIWEGRLSVKNLVNKYFEVNPLDPYDVKVDLAGLNDELMSIDKRKIIEKKQQYRRFIQEVTHNNAYHSGIRFSSIIQQIPLYTSYNPRECLGIDDYVRRLYTMGKVDKFLENQRNVDVLQMVVTRWKFLSQRRSMPTERSINPFGDEFGVSSRSESFQVSKIIPREFEIPHTPTFDYGENHFRWSPHVPLQSERGVERRALLSYPPDDSDSSSTQLSS